MIMQPGAIRTKDVRVGRHIAVSAGSAPRFLARMEQAYNSTGRIDRILSAACGHYRLLWVHPFMEGNGRVARLVSHADLRSAIGAEYPWSSARGLSRHDREYKAHLEACDEPRRGGLDGRGTLSEGALASFTEFFIETCIEEVGFMSDLIIPHKLHDWMMTWALARMQAGLLPPRSDTVLAALVIYGEVSKAEIETLAGTGDNPARGLIAALVRNGIAHFETSDSPLRLSFPIGLANQLLPGAFPSAG